METMTTASATDPTTTEETNRHRAARALVALVLALTTILAAGVPAEAASSRYWSTGSTGVADVSTVGCQYHDHWRTTTMTVPPPVVSGANLSSRRDATWVRYRAYVVDANGRTVRSSSWSGWQLAHDDRALTWSGSTSFSNVPTGSRADVRVEWWNSSRMLGAAALRATDYSYRWGMATPFRASSC